MYVANDTRAQCCIVTILVRNAVSDSSPLAHQQHEKTHEPWHRVLTSVISSLGEKPAAGTGEDSAVDVSSSCDSGVASLSTETS